MDTRKCSLLEAVDYWAEKNPSKTAITFLDDNGVEVDALSYSGLRERVDSIAAHLLGDIGLRKGSTCLLVYPPSLDFTVSYLACLRVGIIAVPCFPPDPRRLEKDLHMFAAIQGSSGASVALTSRTYNYVKKVGDIKAIFSGGATWPELKWVVTDSLPVLDPPASGFLVPDPADVAFLQYTSVHVHAGEHDGHAFFEGLAQESWFYRGSDWTLQYIESFMWCHELQLPFSTKGQPYDFLDGSTRGCDGLEYLLTPKSAEVPTLRALPEDHLPLMYCSSYLLDNCR